MVQLLDEIAAWCAQVGAAVADDDELEAVRLLSYPPKFSKKAGQKGNWEKGGVVIAELREDLEAVGESVAAEVAEISVRAVRRLAAEIARFTLDEAEERRRNGRLEFHDLLVNARQLLRDPDQGWAVRQRLRRRYLRLLLDEFQDTDPIQIDLAVLLASNDPDAGSKLWHDVDVEAGRLFVVGDPKQSIYRFRRADIAMFLEARDSLGGEATVAHAQLAHDGSDHRVDQCDVRRPHRARRELAARVRRAGGPAGCGAGGTSRHAARYRRTRQRAERL
ncbi:MAG: UvrD-helicase domain-containing protein [Acidimicrobiia bacterium]|nr:UvrD-helicase domain-containing protein [Acidimicrobiia bacterium]